jgi:hypothetical protein
VGLLRATTRFVDVFPTWNLPAVGTGTDLAPCHVRRDDRRRLFLDSGCAFDFRIEAARRRFRLDFLGLCHLHHGLRLYPRAVDRDAVGTGLWHRGDHQGADRRGVDRHRGDAVAVAA